MKTKKVRQEMMEALRLAEAHRKKMPASFLRLGSPAGEVLLLIRQIEHNASDAFDSLAKLEDHEFGGKALAPDEEKALEDAFNVWHGYAEWLRKARWSVPSK
jgi:hypothetical protein